MSINEDIKAFIKNHSTHEFPKECCGVVVNKLNNIFCIPLINHSKNINNFTISPIDLLNIKSEYDILYIYHSHTDKNAVNFSNIDINCSKHLMHNLLLYIMGLDIFKVYHFKSGEIENG